MYKYAATTPPHAPPPSGVTLLHKLLFHLKTLEPNNSSPMPCCLTDEEVERGGEVKEREREKGRESDVFVTLNPELTTRRLRIAECRGEGGKCNPLFITDGHASTQ